MTFGSVTGASRPAIRGSVVKGDIAESTEALPCSGTTCGLHWSTPRSSICV